MTSQDESAPKTPAEKLAELVAKRKAAAGQAKGIPGQKQSERFAAARSASKSTPAMRK